MVGEQYSSLSSARAELLLALLADLRVDLGGVLARHQPGQLAGDIAVQAGEVRVDPRLLGPGEGAGQRVVGPVRAVARAPDQRGGANPVAVRAAPVGIFDLGDQARGGQHLQQVVR